MAQAWPITTASVRPDLPSWSMYSITGTCQACGEGGSVAPPSSVKITWISKQCQVSGQPGICPFARNWDGEWDGALPDAFISSRPFQLFFGVRVWPSIWMITPDFWLSRSLDWAANNAEMLAVSLNYQISMFSSGAKAYARKWRNDWACASYI